jgi:hypothetical protein
MKRISTTGIKLLEFAIPLAVSATMLSVITGIKKIKIIT